MVFLRFWACCYFRRAPPPPHPGPRRPQSPSRCTSTTTRTGNSVTINRSTASSDTASSGSRSPPRHGDKGRRVTPEVVHRFKKSIAKRFPSTPQSDESPRTLNVSVSGGNSQNSASSLSHSVAARGQVTSTSTAVVQSPMLPQSLQSSTSVPLLTTSHSSMTSTWSTPSTTQSGRVFRQVPGSSATAAAAAATATAAARQEQLGLSLNLNASNIWLGTLRKKPQKPVVLAEDGFSFYIQDKNNRGKLIVKLRNHLDWSFVII